jgi:hypothetical protein
MFGAVEVATIYCDLRFTANGQAAQGRYRASTRYED